MSVLMKKIERAKWLQKEILAGEPVSADAITINLRSKDNKISFWEMEKGEDIEDVLLAVITNCDRVTASDIVIIDKEVIRKEGLTIEYEEGITKVDDMKDKHRNVYDMDYNKLGILAKLIVEEFKKNEVKRYTRKQIIGIIKNALNMERINIADLKDSMASEVI